MRTKTMEIGLPNRLEFFSKGFEIEFVRRWFSARIIFLTFFVIFWDGFLVFWYYIALHVQSFLMILFPALHVTLGLGLTYYTIAGYLNKTSIKVDYSTIIIKHSPLPFPGNRRIDATNVKQLYSKEKVSHGQHSSTASYEIHVLTKDNKSFKLLSGLETGEQVLFIEQEIEKFLHIDDARVRGEIKR